MAKKIIAKAKAYYGGNIVKPGSIITIQDDVIPSWGKEINSKKANCEQKTNGESGENKQQSPFSTFLQQFIKSDNETGVETDAELSKKSEEELQQILDTLITKGLELGVYLQNTEGKSVVEQIQELTTGIKKAELTRNEG